MNSNIFLNTFTKLPFNPDFFKVELVWFCVKSQNSKVSKPKISLKNFISNLDRVEKQKKAWRRPLVQKENPLVEGNWIIFPFLLSYLSFSIVLSFLFYCLFFSSLLSFFSFLSFLLEQKTHLPRQSFKRLKAESCQEQLTFS